jgi:hypothetical protein
MSFEKAIHSSPIQMTKASTTNQRSLHRGRHCIENQSCQLDIPLANGWEAA